MPDVSIGYRVWGIGKKIKCKTYEILKKSDILPDLEFELVSGEKTSFNKQIVKGKYNLVDMWGYWCEGCILAIPEIKRLEFNLFREIKYYRFT